jgi:dTDP-4-amino-4,6-dideoxygalactose transaminase
VALAEGLRHLALKPGATILVPAYFQGTEIDTLLRVGFKLKFYRLRETFEIDFDDIERKITPQTAALYVIHYFGLPQPIERIRKFCDEKNLKLIEDCALALFSSSGDIPLGQLGDLSFFSVYKTVPLPHGGYVVLRERANLRRLPPPPAAATFNQTLDLVFEHLKSVGNGSPLRRTRQLLRRLRRPLGWERGTTIESGGVVWDKRMMEYGISRIVEPLMGLESPATIVARRRANFEILHRELRRYSPLRFDNVPVGASPLFYPIVVSNKEAAQRELAARGIGSINLWSQPHSACPKELAVEVAPWRDHILELPVHHLHDGAATERVAKISRHYLDNRSVHGAAALEGIRAPRLA